MREAMTTLSKFLRESKTRVGDRCSRPTAKKKKIRVESGKTAEQKRSKKDQKKQLADTQACCLKDEDVRPALGLAHFGLGCDPPVVRRRNSGADLGSHHDHGRHGRIGHGSLGTAGGVGRSMGQDPPDWPSGSASSLGRA